MYRHSHRWKVAQKIEDEYWRKDYFRDSEYKEIVKKYTECFTEIEQRFRFTDETKILDLGCGATCASTLFIKGRKYGLDPLVDVFLSKDIKKLEGKITLVKGDGENVPFEDNFFDVVLCRNVLDHVDNIDRVMKEIQRVSKGIVILSIYVYTPFIAFLKKVSEYIPFLRNVEHPHTFTPESFIKFCLRYLKIMDRKVIFEGVNSIDYGKEDVKLVEPFLHKIVAGINRYICTYNWFQREFLIICKKR